MASSALSNNLKEAVDLRTECLVFGYIRNIKIENKLIPSEIIEICITFYLSSLKIVLFEDVSIGTTPKMNIADFDLNEHYKCTIKPLHQSKTTMINSANYQNGFCFIKNFALPKSIKYINDSRYCDTVFVVGSNHRPRAYIIDDYKGRNIDVYYWELPEPKALISGPYLLHSPKYGLIAVGNEYNEQQNSLNVLSLNNEKYEWKSSTMLKRRVLLSASMIDDDKLICCGGKDSDDGHLYHIYADIYDFKMNKWTKINDLNNRRSCAGICVDKYVNKRVYIGGGIMTNKEFEYFDIIKNKWIRLPQCNGNHHRWPIMWIENVNIINIMSPYGQKIEKFDIRQNKWMIWMAGSAFDKAFGTQFGQSSSFRLCL